MKKNLLFFFVFLYISVNAQTFTNSTGGSIPDNNTEVCFPVIVSGLPTQIDTNIFGLVKVCIDITHTWDSDLKIKLKAPDGTVILLADAGSDGDNYTNTCFSANGADGAIGAGTAPFSGTFAPFESTNLLNNLQDPNGVWYLCTLDEVNSDTGHLYSFSITFDANPPSDTIFGGAPGGTCGLSNGMACLCPDGTQICDLLPDMTASALIIQNNHTEYPGYITLSNATPNIGWGPMEIHGSDSCYCGTVLVPCATVTCPDGSYPKQKLVQTIYHKNNGTITSSNVLTNSVMSYHPTHGHIHVDNWAAFSLRKATSNPDATTWPIVSTGTKVSFCLINLGDCTSNNGYCKDGNYGTVLTQADIPNSPFGLVNGCGVDQGIYVGNLDVYSQGMAGMSIDLTGVCNGDYYIVSITDPDNNFLESKETNNWAATPITLTQQIVGPTASFTHVITGGTQVQFSNPPNINYTYQWYFGDGAASINQNPSHVYTSNGQFPVTLIVTSDCGNDTTMKLISVDNVGIKESAIAALGYSIYPNPINESTTVSYFIPEKSDVNFELYNMVGEKIYSLSRGAQDIGHYEFNLNLKDIGLQSGVYIMQLKTKNKTAAIRLVQLVKQ
jgi:subtilisin-like proprotein convertase family protein